MQSFGDDFEAMLKGTVAQIELYEERNDLNELEEWKLVNLKKFYKQVMQIRLVYESFLLISKN